MYTAVGEIHLQSQQLAVTGTRTTGKIREREKQLKDIIARTELNDDARQEERSAIAIEIQSQVPLQWNVLL